MNDEAKVNLNFDFELKPFGDGALLARLKMPPGVEGHFQLDKATNQIRLLSARRLTQWLQQTAPEREFVAGYDSVLISFNPAETNFAKVAQWVEAEIVALIELGGHLPGENTPRLHRIPVIYGGEYGPDLEEVARLKNLTPAQVIQYHTDATYSGYLVGFSPGFTYLGALPPEIDLPRRSNPRARVPARSVALAAGLTGVYPDALPGGWWLLGYTPFSMFEAESDPPVRILPGDLVQFFAIEAYQLPDYEAVGHDLSASLSTNNKNES